VSGYQVTDIGRYAFGNNHLADVVAFSDSVEVVRDHAFADSSVDIYTLLSGPGTYWSVSWNPSGNTVYWNDTIYYHSTISFETYGGTEIEGIHLLEGAAVTAPTDPTRTGYSFEGWFTDDEFNNEYSFSSMPVEDLTLYAKWERNKSTISFETNDGSLIDPITQDEDSVIIEPANPTKTYYDFVGWYTEPELTNLYTFTTMPIDDFTLYAKWVEATSTINFNTTGGSEVNSITQNENSAVVAPASPIQPHYDFAGWYTEPELLNEYEFVVMPINDITLYAKWTVSQSTITLSNHLSDDVVEITQDEESIVTTPNNPTNEYFFFSGWYLDSELTIPYTFTTMPVEDITVYAKWSGIAFLDIGCFSFDITPYGAKLTDFDNTTLVAIIPDKVLDYIPVIKIGEAAFRNSVIESITIPNTVIELENRAFADCANLTTVIFAPESQLEIIGDEAFTYNFDLVNIVLPDTVTTIGDEAFNYCTDLALLEIPDTVIYIGQNAFYHCLGMTSFVIPESVTYIDESAFRDCRYMTLYLEATEVNANWHSLWNSSDVPLFLGYIEIIDDGEFIYATSVNMEATIAGLSTSNNDTEIVIPSAFGNYNVTSINRMAFKENEQITKITIPNTITEIKENTFDSVTNLTTVIFAPGSQLEIIRNQAFASDRKLVEIVIPNTVTTIEYEAFIYCTELLYINVPLSVSYIGDAAFGGCWNMVLFIQASEENANWDANWNPDDNGVFYGYIETIDDGDLIYSTLTNNEAVIMGLSPDNVDTTVVIPETYGAFVVTYIAERAFRDNQTITNITIPGTVKEIHEKAFDSASNLRAVSFSGIPHLEVIGRSAFAWCSNLEYFIIPDTVISIGNDAFVVTSDLDEITIPLSVTIIGENAFGFSGASVIHIVAATKPAGWHVYWNSSNITEDWDCLG